ncbi:MAG: hypothetical protein ACRDQC_12130 [Gaiellales bacterium]
MSSTTGPLFAGVQIDGLRELRNAMRKAEAGSQKAIARHLKDVAGKVAEDVRAVVPQSAGAKSAANPYASGSARSSVRAFATSDGAGVRGGGASAPYYPWLDFGGSTGRGHREGVAWSGATVRPWMGRPGDGRYIYPVIAQEGDKILQAVMAALDEAELEAGWERA